MHEGCGDGQGQGLGKGLGRRRGAKAWRVDLALTSQNARNLCLINLFPVRALGLSCGFRRRTNAEIVLSLCSLSLLYLSLFLTPFIHSFLFRPFSQPVFSHPFLTLVPAPTFRTTLSSPPLFPSLFPPPLAPLLFHPSTSPFHSPFHAVSNNPDVDGSTLSEPETGRPNKNNATARALAHEHRGPPLPSVAGAPRQQAGC